MPNVSELFRLRRVVVPAIFCCASLLSAANYDFTQIDFPGSCFSTANGINNAGEIAGSYGLCNAAIKGFIEDSGSFTTTEIPTAAYTVINTINNSGQFGGTYTQPETRMTNQGFLSTAGGVTRFAVPDASSTQVTGINDKGQVVGIFGDAEGILHSYLYSNGIFTQLDLPAAMARGRDTYSFEINNAGQIVGYGYPGVGFLYSNAGFTAFAKPDAQLTFPLGINNHGDIVGEYSRDPYNFNSVGFLYSNGMFSDITVPRGTLTTVTGINDNGQIVGNFYDGSGQHGFLLTPIPEPATIRFFEICSVCAALIWFSKQKATKLIREFRLHII